MRNSNTILRKMSRQGLVLIVLLAPSLFTLHTAEGAQTSLRVTFHVTDGDWVLADVTALPAAADLKPHAGSSSFYASVESAYGEVLFATALGSPERIFYDYLDDNGNVTGETRIRDDYAITVQIPGIDPPYTLKITDGRQKVVTQLGNEDILDMNRAGKREYPIYGIDTLVYSGDPAQKVDIVILGDGFLHEDSTDFRNHCLNHINYTFGRVPFEQYSERFNIYAIYTASNERGADHPDMGVYRDTYFNCEYWGRLLYGDSYIAWGVINEHAPQGEQFWMLVQDPTYGGSGSWQEAYSYAASTQVLTHEFGHSYGKLWDEYSYGGDGEVGDAPNCDDFYVDPKWQAWIDSAYPGVGAFSGCSYDNCFRPTYYGCMMLSLTDDFCIVCIEQIINRIYEDAPDPINITYPAPVIFVEPNVEQTFSMQYSNQSDHPMLLSWYLDEELQEGWEDTAFSFTPTGDGQHSVSIYLQDTTSLILNLPDSALAATYTWEINVDTPLCGDADGNDIVNISDAVFLISYIFGGGPAPDYLTQGDPDCNGIVNISDAVFLISYIFGGGPAPCSTCP